MSEIWKFEIPESPYAPPGTVRDTDRSIVKDLPGEDFEIAHHGIFRVLSGAAS